MTLSRRDMIAGAGTFGLATWLGQPALAQSASRRYEAHWGKIHVGGQSIRVARSGKRVTIDLTTELRASLLVAKYAFTQETREVWENGTLVELVSATNDDGKRKTVKARRTSAGLEVDGSTWSGVIEGNPATSSVIVPELLRRPVWIATDSGRPIPVTTTKAGQANFETGQGVVRCTLYRSRGKLKIPVDTYFTSNGDLAGYIAHIRSFDVTLSATTLVPSISEIWTT